VGAKPQFKSKVGNFLPVHNTLMIIWNININKLYRNQTYVILIITTIVITICGNEREIPRKGVQPLINVKV
jgi:hypothetical protein